MKPGWTTWRKAAMLELPFVLLPSIYCVTGNNICFYILTVWGAVYGLTTFLLIFIFQFLSRRVAGKEPFDHELKKSVFRGQLASSAKCDFADLIHRISFRRIGTGEPDTDMIFTEPFDQADKTRIDLQDIRLDRLIFFLHFEGGALDRIDEHSAHVVLQRSFRIIQDQNWIFR